MSATSTMFDRVGGQAFFERLTRSFYAGVASDPVLRPLYPQDEDGFEAARVHLEEFLVQYWGGPDTYREHRGEPRLRWRHARFEIGPAERDAWILHMSRAVTAESLQPLDEAQMLGYFNSAARALTNSGDNP